MPLVNRRTFVKGALASPLLATASCGYTPKQKQAFLERCTLPTNREGDLVIDMHCHLLNAIDADYAAFIERRFLNSGSPVLPQALRQVRGQIDPDTKAVRKEANQLLQRMRFSGAPETALCDYGLPGGTDILVSNDGLEKTPDQQLGDGRYTGFFSSRTRNAAILLAQFRQVDLFVPAIVDFYEGDTLNYPAPAYQMQYYSALAYASRGRFLPMVSFHPERYAIEKADFHSLNNLDLVRGAVEQGAAVGVKVHPSAGFDPLSNVKYAALSGKLKKGQSCEAYRDKYRGLHAAMDEGMQRLYALCDELDVPILTHGSPTLAANPQCMMRGDSYDDWTNSTQHWIEAIRRKPGQHPRVAFAHLAGGPETAEQLVEAQKNEGHRHGSYFEARTADGYTPSPWLQTVLNNLKTDRGDLWIDASIQNEIAYSQAIRENLQAGQDVWTAHRRGRSLFQEAHEDKGQLVDWFSGLFTEYPALKKRMMFGSDLHMPNASRVSGGDAYVQLIQNAVPAEGGTRQRVMGLNAAEFLGLKKGRQTRDRLDKFFAKAGISQEQVPWVQKVDKASGLIS